MDRRLQKALSVYERRDGPFVELSTLKTELPWLRWDWRLIGDLSASRVTKIKPLVGRMHGLRVVVLLSSLREYLLHYNGGDVGAIEPLLRDLQDAQAKKDAVRPRPILSATAPAKSAIEPPQATPARVTVPQPARIDWFRVIVDLERAAWSLERISVAVGRSKGWVSNLKNIPDTEPRFHDGLMLLGLWAEVTGKEQASVQIRPLTAAKGQEPARTGSDTRPVSHKEHPHGQSPAERPDPRGRRLRAQCAG